METSKTELPSKKPAEKLKKAPKKINLEPAKNNKQSCRVKKVDIRP